MPKGLHLQCEHCGVILYIFFIAAVTKQLSNVTVSNGMAWSPDSKSCSSLKLLLRSSTVLTMMNLGTTLKTVAVDYAQVTDSWSTRRHGIDAEGMLWVPMDASTSVTFLLQGRSWPT